MPHSRNFATKPKTVAIAIPYGPITAMCFSIYSEDMFMQKVNYIHENPVRTGLVEKAEDYRWSSIRWWKYCPLEDETLKVDFDQIAWRRGAAS